ncbi:hypothetical protein [Streptosporangium sp. NPDC048865]|uniref:hypothetical protein n=1 Tax=Streptosporangium sp. NPDC048865 TaxID=3155766 RepID=UPI003448A172
MDETVIAIRNGLRWLEQQQKRDGHWAAQNGGTADLTATIQSMRAFTASGFNHDYTVVKKAANWLMRPEVSTSINHYFWRLGALSELHKSGIPEDLIKHDLEVARKRIKEGVSISSKLNYNAFLLDCVKNADLNPSWLKECVEDLSRMMQRTDLDVTPGLWGYAALGRVDSEITAGISVDSIIKSLQEVYGGFHLDGSVTATSYFLLNCTRSKKLSDNEEIKHVLQGTATWIVSRQTKNGSWPVEQPLYDGDPQAASYHTGVAVRALAEYIQRYQPRAMSQIALPEWRLRRTVSRISRWVLLGGALLAIVGALILSGVFGAISTALGVISAILGTIAFYWDARRKYQR